jgi:hypothetical protein
MFYGLGYREQTKATKDKAKMSELLSAIHGKSIHSLSSLMRNSASLMASANFSRKPFAPRSHVYIRKVNSVDKPGQKTSLVHACERTQQDA